MHATALGLCACAALALSAGSRVDENVVPGLLADLAGSWSGSLTYVDYGTGETVEIPMRLRCVLGPDRDHLLQYQEFSDPGATIKSLDVLLPGPLPDSLRTVTVGEGEASVEALTIQSHDVRAPRDWTLVCITESPDGGVLSTKRVTQTLRGDDLAALTEYRRLDVEDAPWVMRNSVSLKRQRGRPQDLAGTWRVDLRPTPDAEEYFQEMVLEVEGGGLKGTFYDTRFSDAALNADGSGVHFAFTTRDASGAYNTTGVLRGDRIEGTTHSLGRGFLATWTAVRKP